MINFKDKNIKIDPKYLERDPNKQYVACISYGKDSLVMLEVIKNYVLMFYSLKVNFYCKFINKYDLYCNYIIPQ